MTFVFNHCARAIRGAHISPKLIDVDIHVRRQNRLIGYKDVWVEVKDYRIDRPIVQKLVNQATDVHHAKYQGKADWSPDILMLVASGGFTQPALALANTYKIYCVHYNHNQFSTSGKTGGRRYYFKGDMSEEDYLKGRNSEYPRNPSTTL